MIEFDGDGKASRDAWLDTEHFAININEYSDGSVRVEVIRGTHLGPSMGSIYVSVNAASADEESKPRPPALRPVPEIEPEPVVKARPEQQRIMEALEDNEIHPVWLALMVGVTRESLSNWRKGRHINGPNIERLREVAETLKVEVPEC